jgi:plastocyanin
MAALFHAASVFFVLALTWAAPTSAARIAPDEPPVEQPTVTVSLRDNHFRPARLTIAAGTRVIWSNDEPDESVEHNVISRDYRWASSTSSRRNLRAHLHTPARTGISDRTGMVSQVGLWKDDFDR